MGIGNIEPISGIIDSAGKLLDSLFTSDDERNKATLESMRIGVQAAEVEAKILAGQQAINQEEAKSTNLFVSGWRPAVGWTGVVALAYQFVLYPLLIWGWSWMQAKQWVPPTQAAPPMLDTNALMVLLTGILGISTSRTFEKVKGVIK